MTTSLRPATSFAALRAPQLSVTRRLAANLTRLKNEFPDRRWHNLGPGYPHPEASNAMAYRAGEQHYFARIAGLLAEEKREGFWRSLYAYTDTLGPVSARQAFATVYGRDFGVAIDPASLVPTEGNSGGIDLLCAIFDRTGEDIAYIVDAPTYPGFITRATDYHNARLYSADLEADGPDPEALRAQIRQARSDGYHVAFYYTIPIGHNPGGISFSQKKIDAIYRVMREEGVLIVEDHPYNYIDFDTSPTKPQPFFAHDPDERVVHLFTASKIGLPGPRVGFVHAPGLIEIGGARQERLTDLVAAKAAGGHLLHNPATLRGFEAYLHDEDGTLRDSLWGLAAPKIAIYGDNRDILMRGLGTYLRAFPEHFRWTTPGAGFVSVFSFLSGGVQTTEAFVDQLTHEFGVVTVPMMEFYSEDAHQRNPRAGLDQLRLSFSFTERMGAGRREDMRDAAFAFANAVRLAKDLPGLEEDDRLPLSETTIDP